jgi:hypothetical protein
MINQRIRRNYFKSLKPKINKENKSRNQIFSILMDEINPLSYFNYFSLDLINMVINIKYLIKKNKIEQFSDFSLELYFLSLKNSFDIINLDLLINETIYNSFIKFSNPIISTQIFLYTCLNYIKNNDSHIFSTEFIKYKVLESIYIENLNLKLIDKNIQFFVILLKTQISSAEFKQLHYTGILNPVIFIFRNLVLNKIKISEFKLKTNNRITTLIFIANKRTY